MKPILVSGAAGQIGTALVPFLRKKFGEENVVASDIQKMEGDSGPFETFNCLDGKRLAEIVKKYRIKTIFHLPALLSFKAEQFPIKAWDLNLQGVMTCLECARLFSLAVFLPSTIGVFGPETPKKKTPQVTVMRPSSIYGITKLTAELLGDYYFSRYGVDTRGIRFPGIVSSSALPGGGTTDFVVEIFYGAVKSSAYCSYLKPETVMEVVYMLDALEAMVQLMEADPKRLRYHNAYNISGMRVSPRLLEQEIKKTIPGFKLTVAVDPVRQKIADSWPDDLEDSAAREDWGWNPTYTLESMAKEMLQILTEKFSHSNLRT
jgi:nucleoside-diphosphate-sugar epimerase